jgi:predicted DNA-binding transcriptional regulator YafY
MLTTAMRATMASELKTSRQKIDRGIKELPARVAMSNRRRGNHTYFSVSKSTKLGKIRMTTEVSDLQMSLEPVRK